MHSPITSPLHAPLTVHEGNLDQEQGGHEQDRHSSEGDNTARKDKIKIFPVFNDLTLSTFSINYSLYLQFFHTILRILGRLLILVVFVNVIDMVVVDSLIQNYSVSQSNNATLTEFCQVNDPQDADCSNLMNDASPYLTEYMQHSVRTSYAVATSVLVLIFLVCMRQREENKVINNPLLYEFNWTQDLFSLLIEKIPRNVTQQEELKSYLEDLEPVKKSNGSVKEIIWVPDYYKAVKLHEKIEKMEKMPLPKEEADQHKHETTLKKLKDALAKEKAALPVHSGKAIVIFDNIETKTLVRKLLSPSMWNFLKRLCRCFDKKVTLENAFLEAKELPEPEDLVFENLCYPKHKKYLRQFAVYFLGLVLIVAASILGLFLEGGGDIYEIDEKRDELVNSIKQAVGNLSTNTGTNNEDSSDNDADLELGFLAEHTISVMILLVESITDIIFRQLNKFTRHKSESELDVNCFYYSIYSSFILYLLIQGFLMTLGITGLESLVQTTTMYLCARYVVRRIANTILLYRNTKANAHTQSHDYASSHDKHPNKARPCQRIFRIGYYALYLSLNIGFQIDLETSEFEFFEEAAKAFPLLALNFAFTANASVSTPTILPSINSRSIIPVPMVLTLLTFYIGAACDKYRMMIQHEDCKLNSARFMLKLYNFFRCDHAAAFLGGFIWVFSFISLSSVIQEGFQDAGGDDMESNIMLYINTYGPSPFYQWMLIVLAAYIFYLFVWPCQPSLETQFGKRFFNNKSNMDYDKVCPEFTSKYHTPELSGHEKVSAERTESAVL